MTIVAGFCCKDGIVLAADTLISFEASKSYESKIFDISVSGYAPCLVAYASEDVNASKGIMEQLRGAIAGLKGRKDRERALKAVIREIHQERYTSASKDEKIFLRLLIANRDDHEEKWGLYSVSGRDFFPVETFFQLGIGQAIGRTIFEPHYRSNMTMWEAKFLAVYGLSIIKQYTQYVGGESEIFLLEDDWLGLAPIPVDNASDLEKHFLFFDRIVTPLKLSFAAFGNEFPNGTFEKRLQSFLKEIRSFRKRGEKQKRDERRDSQG